MDSNPHQLSFSSDPSGGEHLTECRVLYDNLHTYLAHESGKLKKDSGDSEVVAGLTAMRGQRVSNNRC